MMAGPLLGKTFTHMCVTPNTFGLLSWLKLTPMSCQPRDWVTNGKVALPLFTVIDADKGEPLMVKATLPCKVVG